MPKYVPTDDEMINEESELYKEYSYDEEFDYYDDGIDFDIWNYKEKLK